MKQQSCYGHAMCAHHDVPAFTETLIKQYSSFLMEWFLFNQGKRPCSYWWVHTTTGGYQRQGRNQSCHHIMCAVGFSAAHNHCTFHCTFQFTNALRSMTLTHVDQLISNSNHYHHFAPSFIWPSSTVECQKKVSQHIITDFSAFLMCFFTNIGIFLRIFRNHASF